MNTDIRKTLGCLLQTERKRLGFSQEQFATMGGTKPRTLQDWERGASTPSAEFLSNAAKFGLDVLYVVTGQRCIDGTVLSESHSELFAKYDAASQEGKKIIESVAQLAAASNRPHTYVCAGQPESRP